LPEILKINGLTKQFGRIRAVDDLHLTVNKGEVFGLLGPNGSGKTTTLGMVLGLVNPTGGDFNWFEKPPHHASRQRIGATLEQPVFYPYLSAEKNLRIIARIRRTGFDNLDNVLKLVELYQRKDDKFRTYSLGMKQRLAIASTILGNPEVLIFDEPTNGLDPQGIAEIRNLINRIAGEGLTILLASHLLDEVQKTCTHLAVLKNGKNLFTGSVQEALRETVSVELASRNLEILAMALKELDCVTSVSKEGPLLIAGMAPETGPGDINEMLIEKGIVLTHLNLRRKSLEDQFLEILKSSE
jgi:ABC-type multidrug transport system ATPase subunit